MSSIATLTRQRSASGSNDPYADEFGEQPAKRQRNDVVENDATEQFFSDIKVKEEIKENAEKKEPKLYGMGPSNEFDVVKTKIITEEKQRWNEKTGKMEKECLPKLVQEGDEDNKYGFFMNSPVMHYAFGYIGPDGDANTQYADHTKFSHIVKVLATPVDIEHWCSDSVQKNISQDHSRNAAFVELVKKTEKDILEYAYKTSECLPGETESADVAAEENGTTGLEEFIRASKSTIFSYAKDKETKQIATIQTGTTVDEDGKTMPVMSKKRTLVAKRKGIYGKDGTRTSWTVWDTTKDGFKPKDMSAKDWIRAGSAIKFQVRFSFYCYGGNYGVKLDLGSNMIVIKEKERDEGIVKEEVCDHTSLFCA